MCIRDRIGDAGEKAVVRVIVVGHRLTAGVSDSGNLAAVGGVGHRGFDLIGDFLENPLLSRTAAVVDMIDLVRLID